VAAWVGAVAAWVEAAVEGEEEPRELTAVASSGEGSNLTWSG